MTLKASGSAIDAWFGAMRTKVAKKGWISSRPQLERRRFLGNYKINKLTVLSVQFTNDI